MTVVEVEAKLEKLRAADTSFYTDRERAAHADALAHLSWVLSRLRYGMK